MANNYELRRSSVNSWAIVQFAPDGDDHCREQIVPGRAQVLKQILSKRDRETHISEAGCTRVSVIPVGQLAVLVPGQGEDVIGEGHAAEDVSSEERCHCLAGGNELRTLTKTDFKLEASWAETDSAGSPLSRDPLTWATHLWVQLLVFGGSHWPVRQLQYLAIVPEAVSLLFQTRFLPTIFSGSGQAITASVQTRVRGNLTPRAICSGQYLAGPNMSSMAPLLKTISFSFPCSFVCVKVSPTMGDERTPAAAAHTTTRAKLVRRFGCLSKWTGQLGGRERGCLLKRGRGNGQFPQRVEGKTRGFYCS